MMSDKFTRIKPALFLAFFLSGCSGLMYQTVWVRMLTRVLGATTHATATVLVVFMAGLALGAYLSGRFADRIRRPLLTYSLLELAIAVLGLVASFFVIEGVGMVYVQVYDWAGDAPATLLAARVSFVLMCLLLPTVLMGATLPLMIAFITRLGQQFQSSLGWLYAINTYGAVAGVLVTGFYLLGEFGERFSLCIAAGFNLLAAVIALGLHYTSPNIQEKTSQINSPRDTAPPSPQEVIQPFSLTVRRFALLTIFASGMAALAYEILWSRLLVLLLETSIYAFSIMLGTFLVGIAWGSWDSTRQARLQKAPLASFGFLEILIGFWAIVGLFLLPFFHDQWLDHFDSAAGMAIAILACVTMVLPIAFFFGCQFPIAVRCCLADPGSPGRSTGHAYTFNTLGTIAGSLLAGFFLLPLLGTAWLMLLISGVNLVLGVILLCLAAADERKRLVVPAWVLVAGFIVIALIMGDPYQKAMTARTHAAFGPEGVVYAHFEAPAATTVAAGYPKDPRARALFISGVGMTHLCTETKVMAHLPYLLAEQPKRMLIICFGMGSTFRSAVKTYPEMQVDAVDIVPEVFDCFKYYHPDAAEVLKRPNGHTHADDGRNFLLTHRTPYDVITIDPAPPVHSAGTVNLYTKEFFSLCKSRLTPGGVMSMWIPPALESEILMIMKAFTEVFPDGSVWGGLEFPGFYLMGGQRPIQPTQEQRNQIANKLSQLEDLGEWGPLYRDPAKLRQLYIMDAAELAKMCADVHAVTDDKPYTEFPLWRRVLKADQMRPFNAEVMRKRR
ncbi:MAG TPA: fused MFS/spermidine synthase [Gemmatales bacterium]|nr:fused MFS/spermidine synthase [Gemmatales bacterium]